MTNTNGAVVFGDKRTLTGADGSVVIGSSQNGTSTSVKNAVAIGSEANVTKEGGVALGAGSVASVDKGVAGYDPGTGTNSTDTSSVWKSTQAAVSVGDASKGITRQITGVAAGAADRLLASVGRPDLFMEMCVSYLAASEMLSIVENLNDAGVGVLSGLVRKLKRK